MVLGCCRVGVVATVLVDVQVENQVGHYVSGGDHLLQLSIAEPRVRANQLTSLFDGYHNVIECRVSGPGVYDTARPYAPRRFAYSSPSRRAFARITALRVSVEKTTPAPTGDVSRRRSTPPAGRPELRVIVAAAVVMALPFQQVAGFAAQDRRELGGGCRAEREAPPLALIDGGDADASEGGELYLFESGEFAAVLEGHCLNAFHNRYFSPLLGAGFRPCSRSSSKASVFSTLMFLDYSSLNYY